MQAHASSRSACHTAHRTATLHRAQARRVNKTCIASLSASTVPSTGTMSQISLVDRVRGALWGEG